MMNTQMMGKHVYLPYARWITTTYARLV